MAIAGALIGGAIGAFGQKPVVPTLQNIDPNKVQAQTVQGNLANFGDIAKLASSVNTFNQDQLNALIDRALPGARDQIQQNISSQLKGQLPQDVQNQIIRSTAARSVAGGYGGTGMASNLTARDLGLTSLNLINQGLSSAESWLSRATAPQMDASSMFFSPQQRLAFAQQQQGLQFQRDLMAAGVAAAPDPATAALGQEVDRFFNTAASAGMMAGGMGMQQGLGGGGMMGGMGGGLSSGGMGGGGMVGSAGGQGLPGLGQSNLNGSAMWGNQFGGLGQSVYSPYNLGGYGY